MEKTRLVSRASRKGEATGMTDKIERSEEVESTNPPQTRTPLSSKTGPMGFGNGPIIAAGVVAGGALFFAGWGITQLATADDGMISALQGGSAATASATPEEEQAGDVQAGQTEQTQETEQTDDGKVTVTLPDANHNGVPDALEEPARNPAETGTGGDNGQGDEDQSNQSEPNDDASEAPAGKNAVRPQTQVYIIQRGDTLTAISGDTGVPIDLLVEKNRIKNPNLIYAGASLLIPPAE